MSKTVASIIPSTIATIALMFTPSLWAHGSHDHEHNHDEHHEHADDAHEGHAHGAHVHGLAHLDAALDGEKLAVEVRVPGWDLVGFERAPRDNAERAKVEAARKLLTDGARLFAFEPAGACVPDESGEVRLPAALLADTDEHDHGADHSSHDPESERSHPSDWTAAWSFTCADPSALEAIRVDWFDAFPSTERIAVQWIGPAGQSGHELTPSARRIPVAAR